MRWMIAIVLSVLCCAAQAGETATAVRDTEMKARPFTDAATVVSLERGSKVEVLARKASWMQVKTNGTAGWVKMLSLQFGNADKNKTGDNGLRALFNVASGGSGGGQVVTGVRGLSEENLKNAHPNPQALEAVQGYAVNKTEAQEFARLGNLNTQDMDYVAETESGGKK